MWWGSNSIHQIVPAHPWSERDASSCAGGFAAPGVGGFAFAAGGF
tara:strand:- start:137 stop:271 length:135 start_codon:yes stop_codon:yes gene_type:complete